MNFGENIGEQYSLSLEYRNNNQSLFEYIRMFFAVYLFGFFSVFLYFYKEFSSKDKILGFAVILLNIALGFATGTNKYLFDYVVISVAIFLLKEFSFVKIGYKKIVLYSCLVATLLCGSLYFFAVGQSTRYGSAAVSGVDHRLGAYADYNLDDGLFLMGYSALTSYLTQGYRLFDMSLSEDFKWTYGVGNSTFFSRQIDRILDTKISDNSFPARLESKGLDRFINWSTFYLWWASDLTYFGVGFLLAFLGFVFRVSENSILKFKDLDALILYSYLTMCFFYLSANNQLMQSGETAIGFLFVLITVIRSKELVKISSPSFKPI
ncbi:hypothetical protein ACO0K2_01955 [Undibacterium sp. MH2W]|uniref:hypothetical protein n=1 Tax=Undibacterium sp. MH2W TaxID=3413044 RepID=UPI003BF2FA3B